MYLCVCSFQFPGLALYPCPSFFSPASWLSVLFAFSAMQILPFPSTRRDDVPLGLPPCVSSRLVSSRLVSSRLVLSFPLFVLRRCDLAYRRPRLHGVQRAERASISFRGDPASVLPSYFTKETRRSKTQTERRGEERKVRERRREREARFRRRRRRSVSNTPRLLAGEAAWRGVSLTMSMMIVVFHYSLRGDICSRIRPRRFCKVNLVSGTSACRSLLFGGQTSVTVDVPRRGSMRCKKSIALGWNVITTRMDLYMSDDDFSFPFVHCATRPM